MEDIQENKNWDDRCMSLAFFIGSWSKDKSRKIGAVIVGDGREVRSLGYNGFPYRVDESVTKRHARPDKYEWTEHAERNAIYHAARIGVSVLGCRMYVSWFPCIECARAIVQSGIAELIGIRPDLDDPNWGDDFSQSQQMLNEAGVKVRFYSSPKISP